MCAAYTGNRVAPSAISGKLSMLISVGTSAVPRSTIIAMVVVGEPGAVLDAVDAGVDQTGQRVFAEDVGGDPGALAVRRLDRVDENVVAPQRCQVADLAVDPVAHELDPAVTGASLPHHLVGQLRLVVEIDRQPADVPLRARRCAVRRG